MAKRKYPSELNTRTVRVNIGDWQMLLAISRRAGINVAEAFHKMIIMSHLEPEPEHETEKREQIPMMPVFFKPQSISSDGAAQFKPKSISIDGATRLKLKSIK